MARFYKAIPLGYSHDKSLQKDKRQALWKKQQEKYGYDETQLWSLYNNIARFILPRLKSFRSCSCGYPGYFSDGYPTSDEGVGEAERWNDCLDSMIAAFELLAEDGDEWQNSNKGRETVRVGLNNFRDFFLNLWN